MINDLELASSSTDHWKYVDDVTISESLKKNEVSVLQSDLNTIERWTVNNNMKLNGKKCKEMIVSFVRSENDIPRLLIDGLPMPVGRCYKVKCGICGSTFNNDYTSKHCRICHPCYNVTTLATTVCRKSNQSALSTLFVSHVQEQAKSTSRSLPNDTQFDQSSDEEHQPETPIEFKEALFRQTCENDPQSEI
ncbi:Hypothetical predicted protein [Paramuricea clavata]|uniref:Uncharacterized protein n=1 Tax=Paramuricea clavata TaxID=317549 RepID=A0A6S7JQC0_PARCT|nr:Hypothetical predicted protein [Paramuricea clavata]